MMSEVGRSDQAEKGSLVFRGLPLWEALKPSKAQRGNSKAARLKRQSLNRDRMVQLTSTSRIRRTATEFSERASKNWSR